MKSSVSYLLNLIEDILDALRTVKSHLEANEDVDLSEKQGRVYVLNLIEEYCKEIREELRSNNWPKRIRRASKSVSLMRAIADIGWYHFPDDGQSETELLLNLFERLRKSYRRLPEIE